jgi:hypothetical protein
MISNFENFEAFAAHIDTMDLGLRVSWVSGGIGGGNCWNEGGHYGLSAEPEPEDETLAVILETFCPNLSYLQYRRLSQIDDLYIRESKTEREYYGNYTEYETRELNLEAVYDFLVKIKNGS